MPKNQEGSVFHHCARSTLDAFLWQKWWQKMDSTVGYGNWFSSEMHILLQLGWIKIRSLLLLDRDHLIKQVSGLPLWSAPSLITVFKHTALCPTTLLGRTKRCICETALGAL